MEGVFLPTHWSVVRRAVAAKEPGAAKALATLCESWWYPIYAYIRRAGQAPHNAEDLTQGFFEKLLASNLLAAADPAKGRLRTFLLTCVNRFMADEHDRTIAGKRGGGSVVNWSSVRAEERYAAEQVDDMTPDRLYQRRWALTVLDTTLWLLSEQYAAAGKENLFEVLQPFLGFGHEAPESYEAVASRLGMNTSTLKSHVRRLRLDWRKILMGQVAGTLDEPSSDNVRDEMAELMDSV
jgi:DNA-directed RNA polymerase specialized sigma24 family protein